MGELFDKLANYGNSGIYPFHMPGHKRQKTVDFNPYKIDITEIEGFDNLHHAKGLLLEAQQYAIGYYAKEGFQVVSDPFLEDGIPHVQMRLTF